MDAGVGTEAFGSSLTTDIFNTLKEVREVLGVTTKTLQRWDKEGKIRAYAKGRGGT
ncbi:MAG: MerR family DNA-binding transcriptional regulator [Candidatus Methanospirareceae archaeon]